jgi:hypothetical protein
MVVQCERIYSCEKREVAAIRLRACMPFMLFISSQYNSKVYMRTRKKFSVNVKDAFNILVA